VGLGGLKRLPNVWEVPCVNLYFYLSESPLSFNFYSEGKDCLVFKSKKWDIFCILYFIRKFIFWEFLK
jgi:hypothetical protein